jgi:hypothetical protein
MRIESWNVCTLYRAGAVNEFVKEMDKCKIDMYGVQEIIWSKEETVIKKSYMILYIDIKVTNTFWNRI